MASWFFGKPTIELFVYALECKLEFNGFINHCNVTWGWHPEAPYFACVYVFVGVLLAT